MEHKEMKNPKPKASCASKAITIIMSLLFCSPLNANEEIADAAKKVSVRIEGATQGSGVIVQKGGNKYTVLTAWHVLKSNKNGEEISIFTVDGKNHITGINAAKKLPNVDLAEITFESNSKYEIARQGDTSKVKSGAKIYVSGFPLPSSAVPVSIYRFFGGNVIANATGSKIPRGYELLYDNPTLPGMSGGAVLDINGELVGIHGQGETDISMTEQYGIAVKTGTNQAVPIAYWKNKGGLNIQYKANKIDSLLAKALNYFGKRGPWNGGSGAGSFYPFNGYESEVIELASNILEIEPGNYRALYLRGRSWLRKPSQSAAEYARADDQYITNGAAEFKDRYNQLRDKYTFHGVINDDALEISERDRQRNKIAGLVDLTLADYFKPNDAEIMLSVASAYAGLDNKKSERYYSKLVNIDKRYLYQRYEFLKWDTERKTEACNDFYGSIEAGNIKAINTVAEKMSPGGSLLSPLSWGMRQDGTILLGCPYKKSYLDPGKMLKGLDTLNRDIRRWELERGFGSSKEAEQSFASVDNSKRSKQWSNQFVKDSEPYIMTRYARGSLKYLMGKWDDGMCNDLLSSISWGGSILWIKYRQDYLKRLCGANVYKNLRGS